MEWEKVGQGEKSGEGERGEKVKIDGHKGRVRQKRGEGEEEEKKESHSTCRRGRWREGRRGSEKGGKNN